MNFLLAIPGMKKFLAIAGLVLVTIASAFTYVKISNRKAVKKDRLQSRLDAYEKREEIRKEEAAIDAQPEKSKNEIIDSLLRNKRD